MTKIILAFALLWWAPFTQAQVLFPDQCTGTWKGMMYLYNRGQLSDSVAVKLLVAQEGNNVWTWRLDYLSAKLPVSKDYKMKFKAANSFLMDEGDGTLLSFLQHDQKLYSIFEVEGLVLTASYELINHYLLLEVSSAKAIPSTNAAVKNFEVSNVQKVLFTRLQ